MQIDLWGAAPLPGLEPNEGLQSKSAVSDTNSSTGTFPEDSTSLSSAGELSAPVLVSQALSTAAARLGKVESLRQAVASAQYTVDPEQIAGAMINEGL